MNKTTKYLVSFFLLVWAVSASAQTRVERHLIGDGRGDGVVYFLPQTLLKVEVEVDRVEEKAGLYAGYAQELIGQVPSVRENAIRYHLKAARLGTYGIPNKDLAYQIEYRKATVAPFVSLTEDGLLCAINADYSFPSASSSNEQKESVTNRANGFTSNTLLMSQDYNAATTPRKRAEILARELQNLLETKMNVLGGDAEQPFPDGQAMKIAVENIDKRLSALQEMFTGTVQHSPQYHKIQGLRADSTETYVAFRFSPDKGVVDSTDLSGEPVYLKIRVIDSAPELSERDAERLEKHLKGIVYYNPGRIQATLTYKGEVLDDQSFPIAQLGTRESLARVLFNTRGSKVVRVIFYPETAAIKEITDAESE